MTTRPWFATIGMSLALASGVEANTEQEKPLESVAERYAAQIELEAEWMRRDAATRGDLNNDGEIGIDDLRSLLANVGSDGALMDGDLNSDGVVDRDDVRALLRNFGGDRDSAEVLRAIDESGLMGGTGNTPPWPPGDHFDSVSSYPGDPPSDHQASYSQSHPNHVPAYSNGWGEHDSGTSGNWPGNHPVSVSGSWPKGDHPWPPGHDDFHSQVHWPGNHTDLTSATWPPNHNASYSVAEDPGHFTHNTNITSSWGHDHHPGLSATWPTNHSKTWSLHWNDHTEGVSKTWPHNHLQGISNSWDDNNHAASVSRTWPPSYVDPDWEDPDGGPTVTPIGPIGPIYPTGPTRLAR